jgi:SAM-dependent methyltransferase
VSAVKRALRSNQGLWDEWARAHYLSAFYDVVGFRRGGSRLRGVELEEIGPVKGRDLLHLQCHFGLDTLSFARLGAHVTGVDFSGVAIEQARVLASELELEARFIRADILDLPRSLAHRFDIVYTSRGVLGWIPDLDRWAGGIARCLRAGALFYMLEGHPVAATFDDTTTTFRLRYPYFAWPRPQRYRVEGSYADRGARFRSKVQYEWPHSLGEVITALASAGLRIDFVHEFPFAFWETVPWLVKRGREWWLPKRMKGELPLSFSLAARKPDPRLAG